MPWASLRQENKLLRRFILKTAKIKKKYKFNSDRRAVMIFLCFFLRKKCQYLNFYLATRDSQTNRQVLSKSWNLSLRSSDNSVRNFSRKFISKFYLIIMSKNKRLELKQKWNFESSFVNFSARAPSTFIWNFFPPLQVRERSRRSRRSSSS